MPVSLQHELYLARTRQWERCRHAYDGGDCVKDHGEAYLPKLPVQSDDEYESYKQRAMWYGATGRTVNGLAGAVTRRDPKFTVPSVMKDHLDDVTLSGVPATIFVKQVITELLTVGRYGILVDMAADAPASATAARPYWTGYRTEQIINWRTSMVNGVVTLTMVVLAECAESINLNDEFEVKKVDRYRVLTLQDGVYRVRLFTPRSDKSDQYDVAETIPTFRGKPLTEIPFCFIGVCGLDAAPEKPPLLDLVDVNFSHYCSSADLEHGRHYTALPTPWVAGFTVDPGTSLRIGSAIAWVASDPQAKAGMLEFTGQGLGALEKALESKEGLMAILGARMLEVEKAGVEATDTLLLRSAGERSTLQSMAIILGLGLTRVLRWHAMWMAIKETSTINAELNSDFTNTPMGSSELTSLVQTWQAGGMSYETFYYNLQRGELTRPGITADDERTLIETQQATLIETPSDNQDQPMNQESLANQDQPSSPDAQQGTSNNV